MFRDNLKTLRKRKGLTQLELAEKLGIAQSTLASYERGIREPNFEMLENIADYFNVPMAELLGSESKVAEAYNGYRKEITAERQAVLDAVDGMSVDELKRLLKIIDAMK